jgi:hypothetical protein
MDLVKISLLPSSSGELRRLAEERILTQLPQLPLGQRLMLARRGSSRVAAGLIAGGPEQAARAALDNPFLIESHLLKALAKEDMSARTVAAVSKHAKWSKMVNIRVALLRHPHAPPDCVAEFVPDLSQREIEDLFGVSHLPEGVRSLLRHELKKRDMK